MLLTSKEDIILTQISRPQNSTMKLLKEVFHSNKKWAQNDLPETKGSLDKIISKMKVQKMKDYFYKRLTYTNIYKPPTQLKLLSEQQKNKRRLIKWKGIQISQKLLSIMFLLQIVFLLITFVISSWMAFLPNFTESGIQNSAVVIGLNSMTAFFSLSKIVITSTNQTIKKGIIFVYVTDIFMDYTKSFIIFVDLIYLVLIIALFILRSTFDEIHYLSVFLFIWSIVRIILSSENLIHFHTNFIDSFKKEQYYKLFKVVIFNFIFAHFIASMLLAMALINSQSNWMIAKNIQDQIWYVQYIWAYYWATTTMMTVGFGDFVPVTYTQGLILSFLELFSCIVLAYNISEIGSIIAAIRASQNQYTKELAIFKRMAEQNEIDLELKIRIDDFLRQQKTIKQKFEFNQQLELLERLPESLRKEFIMASNGKTFRYLPFFKNLQKNTLIQLVEIITSKVYYPGEAVVKAKQQTETLMILKEGKVGLIYRKENSLLNGVVVEEIEVKEREILTDGGKFVSKKTPILLTVQFLSPGKIINYDMNALTYSYLFQIDYQKFMEIIKSSELDKELFFSIVHSHTLTTSEWQQLPCQHCSISLEQKQNYTEQQTTQRIIHSHYHTKFQCPNLHYMLHKALILLKHNRSQGKPQQSKSRYRRTKEKSSSCLMLRKNEFKLFEQKSLTIQNRQLINQREESIRPSNYSVCNNLGQNESPLLQQSEEEVRTIVEPVFKYAVDEVYPHHFSLSLWDLEIDAMWNYWNYYPHQNAARFNNLKLEKKTKPKEKLNQNKENINHSSNQESIQRRRKYQPSYYRRQQSNDSGVKSLMGNILLLKDNKEQKNSEKMHNNEGQKNVFRPSIQKSSDKKFRKEENKLVRENQVNESFNPSSSSYINKDDFI